LYARESFTDEEREVLNRFFTNTDLPVFAVVNLPEIVKGAMFARYSRTHMSLRRLFLEEFYEQPDIGIQSITDTAKRRGGSDDSVARRRAEELYRRVFVRYGDDSVAQLGGAHLACEQVSAVLAKMIERGRLAAYLEQSTRYIYFDEKLRGEDDYEQYRYHVPSEIAGGPLANQYVQTMDKLFASYSFVVRELTDYFQARFPKKPEESHGAYGRATRARACDSARGLLPAATTSNVGVFATGQAYEAMLTRMNASPSGEARSYSKMMLTELRKVISGFLTRVDVEDRGVAWSRYFERIAEDMNAISGEVVGPENENDFDVARDEVKLLEWDHDAEVKTVAAALYPYSHRSEEELLTISTKMNPDQRRNVLAAYIGDRTNRRHKPGRGMERVYYRFDVLSDFGSFRDLQRHRMMTIDWQTLTPRHGYATPPEIEDASRSVSSRWHDAMSEITALYEEVLDLHGEDVAQYVVPFGFRIRYNIQMNARQAFHMLELRTGESGHSDYRRICLKMHELIRDQARHHAIADAMIYVDSKDYGLGRLSAERRQIDGEQLGLDLL
jgi:thymidylate synthase ThyX